MYSIRRKGEIFQVLFCGNIIADNLSTFKDGKDAIAADEYEQDLICQGEMEQERYIAANFDECGNRFRNGDEW